VTAPAEAVPAVQGTARQVAFQGVALSLGAVTVLLLIDRQGEQGAEVAVFIGTTVASVATLTLSYVDTSLMRRQPGSSARGASTAALWIQATVHAVLAVQLGQTLLGILARFSLAAGLPADVAVPLAHRAVLLGSVPLMIPVVAVAATRIGARLPVWVVTVLGVNYVASLGVAHLITSRLPDEAHYSHDIALQVAQLTGMLAVGAACGLLWATQTARLEAAPSDGAGSGRQYWSPMRAVSTADDPWQAVRAVPWYVVSVAVCLACLWSLGAMLSDAEATPAGENPDEMHQMTSLVDAPGRR
jgi:hypothetical protein